jgi:hypothetical protein
MSFTFSLGSVEGDDQAAVLAAAAAVAAAGGGHKFKRVFSKKERKSFEI